MLNLECTNRTRPLQNIEYDKEKYKELLLDAAETVLGIFGFDSALYVKANDKK